MLRPHNLVVTATTIAETEANAAIEGIAVTEGIVETAATEAIAVTGVIEVIGAIGTREVIAETEGTGVSAETGVTEVIAVTAMIETTTTMMRTCRALVVRLRVQLQRGALKKMSAPTPRVQLQIPRQTILPHKSLLLEVC
ncbi:hypothetical protein [Roseibium sp.]|uniref:hypothetical protein n=1 Tax=Roseibium sp. TaxID=1936156 RepID=UPI0039EF8952